jgi:hypothetical protein
MITVEDLIWKPISAPGAPGPDMDPLTESDALQEAQLLDLRLHAVSSTAGLLFELRTALQFEYGNAALLVIRGLRQASWRAVERGEEQMAWSVMGSAITARTGHLELNITLAPSASVEILGTNAEFYVLDVPEMGETPPDYCFDREVRIRAGLPNWGSPVSILYASYLDRRVS